MRHGLVRKLGVSVTLAAFLLTSSGCFGGFNLTRKVYGFNKTVSRDKWVQELVFLALVIVPVYGIATFVDAIFINSIEFWTGDNPVRVDNEPTTRVVERGDVRVVQTMTATADHKTMVLQEYHGETLVRTTTMRQDAGQPSMFTEVRYPDGRVETHVVSVEANGSAIIGSVDDEGRATTRFVSVDEVERLGDRAQALAAAAGSHQVASAATRSW